MASRPPGASTTFMATLPFGETLPYDDGNRDDLDTSSSASSEEIFDMSADDVAVLDQNIVEDAYLLSTPSEAKRGQSRSGLLSHSPLDDPVEQFSSASSEEIFDMAEDSETEVSLSTVVVRSTDISCSRSGTRVEQAKTTLQTRNPHDDVIEPFSSKSCETIASIIVKNQGAHGQSTATTPSSVTNRLGTRKHQRDAEPMRSKWKPYDPEQPRDVKKKKKILSREAGPTRLASLPSSNLRPIFGHRRDLVMAEKCALRVHFSRTLGLRAFTHRQTFGRFDCTELTRSRLGRVIAQAHRRLPGSLCMKSRMKIGIMYRGPWGDQFVHGVQAIRFQPGEGRYFAAAGSIHSPSGNSLGYIRIFNYYRFQIFNREISASTAAAKEAGIPIENPPVFEPYHCLATRTPANDLAWCPWDKNIVAVSHRTSPKIELYDLQHWPDKPSAEFAAARADGLSQGNAAILFLPRTKQLVSTGTPTGCVRVWDTRTPAQPKYRLCFKTAVAATALCASPDGRTVFAGNVGGEIAGWDLRKLRVPVFKNRAEPVLKTTRDVKCGISSMSIKCDKIAVRTSDGRVGEWHNSRFVRLSQLEAPKFQPPKHAFEFLPPRDSIVCAGLAGAPTITFLDLHTGHSWERRLLKRSNEGSVVALGCSNTGDIIAALGNGELVSVGVPSIPLFEKKEGNVEFGAAPPHAGESR